MNILASHTTFISKITDLKNIGTTALLSSLLVFSSVGYTDDSTYATGVLKTRQHEIQIINTDNGTRYSVVDLQGNEIATELTQEELLAQLPELESLITTGTAEKSDVKAPTTEDILLQEPNEDPLQENLKSTIDAKPEK